MIITPTLVILMIVVFILLFLFLNTVDKRKWLTILISLVLTPVIYFYIAYPFINIISNYHHQKYFSAIDWQEKPSLRYEMIDNTVETDTLIDMSKYEIEKILGKAEWLSWDDAKKAHDQNRWNYGLGIEPGAFTDEKSNIEITFKNNIVSSLRAYTELISFDVED